jgi:hypothetical protein
VIAPVIAKPVVEQVLLVHELVDWQQLDGGDAERRQVFERCRVCKPCIGTADLFGDIRMPLREPFQMHLIDDCLVQLPAKWCIAAPIEGVVDDDRFRHVWRAVFITSLQIVSAERIREDRRMPVDSTRDGAGVWIDEELGWIAPQPVRRIPWSMDAESIALPWVDSAQMRMPAERGLFRKVDARLVAIAIEEAQLDTLGDFGEEREIGPASIPCRSHGEWLTGAHVPRLSELFAHRAALKFCRAHVCLTGKCARAAPLESPATVRRSRSRLRRLAFR